MRIVRDEPEEPGALTAAVDQTIGALKCPPSDAAVIALARTVAGTIDAMPAGQRGMMLGQTGPLLLRTLQELEARAVKRRGGKREGPPGKVSQLRAAHAQTVINVTDATSLAADPERSCGHGAVYQSPRRGVCRDARRLALRAASVCRLCVVYRSCEVGRQFDPAAHRCRESVAVGRAPQWRAHPGRLSAGDDDRDGRDHDSPPGR